MNALFLEYRKGRRSLASRVAVVVLAMCLILSLAGCYGQFPLTRAIYDLNGKIGRSIEGDETQNKFAQSVVFWVFVIIPVYEFAGLGDALVLNLIEFWTGNTMTISDASGSDGRHMRLDSSPDGRTATLMLMQGERVLEQHQLVRVSEDRLELRDAEGRVLGSMERTPDGGLDLLSADGRLIESVPREQVDSFKAL